LSYNTINTEVSYAILQKAPMGIILTGTDGSYLYGNPAFTAITGYTITDVPDGRTWLHSAYPDKTYRTEVVRFWKEDVTKTGIDRVFQVVCKDGSTKEIEFRPFLLDDGRAVTILSDITAHRKAEQSLRESEERFRILFEESRDAIFISSRDGGLVHANRAFLDLFRCDPAQVQTLNVANLYFNPSDRKRFQAEIEQTGSVRDFEVILKKLDGSVMDCLLTAAVRKATDGSVLGYQGIIRDVSLQKQMEETLRQSEAKYRSIFEATGTAMIIMEDNGILSTANHEFTVLSGYGREEIEGKKSFSEFIDQEDADRMDEYHRVRRMTADGAPHNYELRLINRSSDRKDIFITVSMMPGTRQTIASLLDITEQKQFQEAIAKSHRTMRDIIENAPIGVMLIDTTGAVEFINPEMVRISGTTRDQFQSLNVLKLPGYSRIGLSEKIQRGLQGEYFRLDSVEYTSYFGKRTTISNFTGMPFEESGKKKLLLFVEDITKQKFSELQLSYLATHDTLTGLPNRTLFYDRLNIALANAHRYDQRLAVMLFDLDRFKEVNDSLGHKVGDALLKSVGERITDLLRSSDTLARMGGDEFLVLLSTITMTSDVDIVLRKMLDAFRKPFLLEGRSLTITTSIGVSVYPDDGVDSETLVKRADIAMYLAKQGGRNGYRKFSPLDEGTTDA
jgi:diguanylate cyclase (GGDEF)-like protein/PAS domain S-box-containing protein